MLLFFERFDVKLSFAVNVPFNTTAIYQVADELDSLQSRFGEPKQELGAEVIVDDADSVGQCDVAAGRTLK